jgi:hypothetical protein
MPQDCLGLKMDSAAQVAQSLAFHIRACLQAYRDRKWGLGFSRWGFDVPDLCNSAISPASFSRPSVFAES